MARLPAFYFGAALQKREQQHRLFKSHTRPKSSRPVTWHLSLQDYYVL